MESAMKGSTADFLRRTTPMLLVPLVLTACAVSGPSSSPPPALSGTRWNVVEIDGRKPVGAGPLTAEFAVDGRVSGDSGCNTFSGPYIQDGSKVNIGELMSTRRACTESDRQAQETRLLAILQGEVTMRQQERRELIVRGNDGTLTLAPSF
jgi:heat shock protein HslJ